MAHDANQGRSTSDSNDTPGSNSNPKALAICQVLRTSSASVKWFGAQNGRGVSSIHKLIDKLHD